MYGEDGADTIDAQTAVELAGAREEIFAATITTPSLRQTLST